MDAFVNLHQPFFFVSKGKKKASFIFVFLNYFLENKVRFYERYDMFTENMTFPNSLFCLFIMCDIFYSFFTSSKKTRLIQ